MSTSIKIITLSAFVAILSNPSYAQQAQTCSQTCDTVMQAKVNEFHAIVNKAGTMGQADQPAKIILNLEAIAGKAREVADGYKACFQSNCPSEIGQ